MAGRICGPWNFLERPIPTTFPFPETGFMKISFLCGRKQSLNRSVVSGSHASRWRMIGIGEGVRMGDGLVRAAGEFARREKNANVCKRCGAKLDKKGKCPRCGI